MWSQLFSQHNPPVVEQPAPPVRNGPRGVTISLGDELPDDVMDEGIPSELPTSSKAEKAADQLRRFMDEESRATWKKLQKEFDVQKLVWESLIMVRGKDNQQEIETLRQKMSSALDETNFGSEHAVNYLEQALKAGMATTDIFGNSMKSATENVIKHCKLTAPRKQLAAALDESLVPNTSFGTSLPRSELESLTAKCDLKNPKLERCIRQTLQLSIPIGLGQAVTGSKKSSALGSAVGGSRKSSSLGSVVSGKRSSALGGAVSGSKKSSSRRPGSRSRIATAAGIPSDQPFPVRAVKAAEAVRSLATTKVNNAWKRLQEEFNVQILIWQSLKLARKENEPDPSLPLKSTFEQVLASKDPAMLEQALNGVANNADLLSNSVLDTSRAVLAQEQCTSSRRALASRLDAASMTTASVDKKQLEQLIVESKLADAKVECVVRQLFSIPVPPELGAAVKSASKSSPVGPSVKLTSSRKSSSLGAVVSAPRKSAPATASGTAPNTATKTSSSTSYLGPPVNSEPSLSSVSATQVAAAKRLVL